MIKEILLNSEKTNNFYKIFYSAALCVGMILLANQWLSLSIHHIFIVLAAVLLQFIIHYTEERKLRLPLLISIIVLIIVTVFLLYKRNAESASYYYYLSLEALCIITSIICYLSRDRIWMKTPINLGLISCLIYFSIQKISLPRWIVYIVLLCFLLFLADMSAYHKYKKSNYKELYLTPVLFIALLLLLIVPIKESPIRWQTVKDFAKTVREGVHALVLHAEYLWEGGDGNYSISFAGYGGNGQLKGDVLSSDHIQVSIRGSKTKRPLYLTGSIYNSYNGHNWDYNGSLINSADEEYFDSYDQLKNALEQSIYTEDDINAFMEPHFYDVEYGGLRTKSVFRPIYTSQIQLQSKVSLMKNSLDDIRLSKAQGHGFQYRVQFYEIDFVDAGMKDFLRGKAWNHTPIDRASSNAYTEYIYNNYMSIPEIVPDRVYDLAQSITASYDNDYDKLKAIEQYVSTLSYSLTPAAVPADRDVTDYFLFESKSGYCTYFATAMAILARCEGIPSRYVEGMVSQDACRYSNQLLNLRGNNSHAWVEAYIPHIGWIPFEPTPGYYENANKVIEASIPSSGTAPITPTTMPEIPLSQDRNLDPMEESPSFFFENRMLLLQIAIEIVLIVIVLILFIMLFLFIRNRIRKTLYMRKNDYEKITYHMIKIFSLGKLYGYPMEAHETLSGYENRTKPCLDTADMEFSILCSLFQSIRFGHKKILYTDIESMESYTQALEKQYLSDCGYFKRLLYYIY